MSLRTPCLAALCLLAAAVLPAQAAAIRDSSFTTSDGVRIHALEAGKAAGAPALVLIPGWTLSASLWRGQLEAFSGERLVIALDSRSQGASDKVLQNNTPERRAADLHELLAARHLERIVLVGWSQGAQDVAAYIRQYGTGTLAGIVFVDSPVAAGPEEVTLNPGFTKVILSGLSVYAAHPAEYSEGMVRSIFARPHPELDLRGIIDTARGTPPQTGMAMLLADLFGADRRDALKKIDRPALVIAAAGSPLLDQQKAMAAAIPGAHLVVVPDAGHAVFVDQPEAFDQALGELLSRAGGAG